MSKVLNNQGSLVESTSNKNCRRFVINCKPFKASNLFGILNQEGIYVVYSYGYHFPLFAFLNGQWYENTDKYSVTTSKHKSQANPLVDTIKLNTNDLKTLIRG